MSSTSPYLLYPSAFLTPRDASAVMNDLDRIVESEVANLKEGAINLYKDPNAFTDFQKVIFNANYDARLQPYGFENRNRNIGVDLYNELSAEQAYRIETTYRIETSKYAESTIPLAHYVIQPINLNERSIDLNWLNLPVVYISSPYSVAKAISNIANNSEPFGYSGGYLMCYGGESLEYAQSIISGQIPGRDNKLTTETYYPHSSGDNRRSITVKTGKGRDFVLFDNSHSGIYLSDGDDTAAPSAAAFLPSIQFGQNIVNSIRDNPLRTSASGRLYTVAGRPIKEGNVDYGTNTTTPKKGTSILLNGYVNKFDRPSEWYASKTDITDAEQDQSTINIGGQSIYGEAGNDILYGFDPLLYAGMTALETKSYAGVTSRYNDLQPNGPLSLKFLNNAKTNINWTPILLSGGKDQDIFMIGALSKINLRNGKINTSDRNGSTFYTLLGDKNTLGDVSLYERQQQSWGEELSADTYMLTASYDYTEEVIQKGINIDYSTDGVGIDPFGAAQVATKGAKAGLDVTKAVTDTFKKVIPGTEAVLSVANLGIEIAKVFSKPKPAIKSKFYRDELKQKVVPPGSWNQAINIPDWDPRDRIVVQTIPIEDPEVKQAESWDNINFSLIQENSQVSLSGGSQITVNMETAVGGKKPVIYLDGLELPNKGARYGFETYDFFTGKENTKIDPLKDITYFGVLANTDKTDKIKTAYVEPNYNLQIDKDDSLFLWNSLGLRKAGLLNQYRSAASSIQMGVDTRKFGWYTDLKLNSSGTEVDLSTSQFYYWDRDSKGWVSISLQEFTTAAPESQNAQLARKAQFNYWTAQDSYANTLMNLSAADADNTNDVEFYKSRDDGSVLDPVTGEWLAPGADGYEQAALSDQNYAGAFSVKQNENGSVDFLVDEGMKLSPFIETTFADGRVDHIFAFDDVHANDPEHTRDSMVQIDDTGVIRFEDVIGGDYDYNDAVLDPTLYPELAALLASSLFN